MTHYTVKLLAAWIQCMLCCCKLYSWMSLWTLQRNIWHQHTLSPGLMLGSPFGPTLCSRLNAIFCVRPNSFPATVDSTSDSQDGTWCNKHAKFAVCVTCDHGITLCTCGFVDDITFLHHRIKRQIHNTRALLFHQHSFPKLHWLMPDANAMQNKKCIRMSVKDTP